MTFRTLTAVVAMAMSLQAIVPLSAQDVAGAPQATAAPSAPSADAAAALADYQLGVADHVRVSVYNEPDLSGESTVSATGTIALPLIGSVKVAGKTASEAAFLIQSQLRGRYLKDPHVSLEVLTYRPYYILGEVTKPGEYPYSNGLTIQNAVATAEGFTYRANKKRAFVKHSGEPEEKRVDIAPGTLIQPGDTIRIGERHL